MWRKMPLLQFFSKVCYSGATFQISSKSDNKRPSYARFCEIQDGGGGHLGCGAKRRLNYFSAKNVAMVLSFKFHRNRTINGRFMQDFVESKMAAAAILDVAQNPAFVIFQ